MKKLPLSICILTDRTDDLFLQALKSAQCAEEVIILENGRAENTLFWETLPTDYTFHVVSQQNPITDFAAARNRLIELAQHNWILFLDSDEVLTMNSYEVLESCIIKNQYSGMYAVRSDIFYDYQLRYGEAGRQRILRMGKKNDFHFSGKVHEEGIVTGSIAPTTFEIQHYSHASISEFINTVSRYSQLVAEERTWSMAKILIELFVFPLAKFIRGYIFQLGFLDGWYGFVYALCMSLHSLSVRIYGYEKQYKTTRTI